VSVSDRVATLSGLVDDEEQSATANEITAAIPGILRVANELRAHTRIRARNA
jgi:osmotically-inducible protein OsmY